MERLPIKETLADKFENVRRIIGARVIAGLERFDDAHDIDWGIEDDEEDPALFGRDLVMPPRVYEIPDNIILGED